MKNKLVLKVCTSIWKNASRDERELAVCRELGAEVLVFDKGEMDENGLHVVVNGFNVIHYSTRPLGDHLSLREINRVLAMFILAYHARALRPDVITGHNLPGVIVGWMANLGLPTKKKATLVYDAHEFEIGRGHERNKLLAWLIPMAEKFFIKRCAFSIMINDGIADEIQRSYRLKTRAVVVRSTPEYWQLDKDMLMQNHRLFCDLLKVPQHSFITMYHGYLQPYRGLEDIIEAMAIDKSIYSVWMCGVNMPNESAYAKKLWAYATEAGVTDRILRYAMQPHDTLWQFVGAADCGIVMNDPVNQNYKYALPNKFFENVQSLTPLICSDTSEMAKLISQYDIGLSIKPGDGDGLAKAIAAIRDDKKAYARFKFNLVKAKKELCWEKEKRLLIDAYKSILK